MLEVYADRADSTNALGMLATLERERLAGEARLAPLDYPGVDMMLRAIFDQRRPIRGDFLSALYALAEGNPFFIEEVLKSLVTERYLGSR